MVPLWPVLITVWPAILTSTVQPVSTPPTHTICYTTGCATRRAPRKPTSPQIRQPAKAAIHRAWVATGPPSHHAQPASPITTPSPSTRVLRQVWPYIRISVCRSVEKVKRWIPILIYVSHVKSTVNSVLTLNTVISVKRGPLRSVMENVISLYALILAKVARAPWPTVLVVLTKCTCTSSNATHHAHPTLTPTWRQGYRAHAYR